VKHFRKVISFSIWGNLPFYCEGAIQNAFIAKNIYPDWETRFYVKDVPEDIKERLKSLGSTVIEMQEENLGTYGMFWRFYPIDDEDVEFMISRDVDSRLSAREKHAVDEWIASGKSFHVMRDHPYHNLPVQGGMWGIRKTDDSVNFDIKNKIKKWFSENPNVISEGIQKSSDQKFLESFYFPFLYSNDYFVHDQYPYLNSMSGVDVRQTSGNNREISSGFPTRRINGDDFVGQVYDENNVPDKNASDHVRSFDRSISIVCSLPEYEIEPEIKSMMGYDKYNSSLTGYLRD
tara:strand:- start:830 stop:1699 length:870 start_codon:yes stop_codon:yes gene_type:complete